jgi:aminopeptidase N
MDVDKESNIDMPFYVTAHEVAHQWWGHQVMGANVQGASMIDESMAQYSALMVMEHEYGKANMQKFLKYEMDKYLSGRSSEHKRELPLYLNENQGYIHYNKGSLVFYALRDYIGEEKLNMALSEYVKRYAFKQPPFSTTKDMLNYIKKATPDSIKYIINDLFETITLYNNKTLNVTSQKISDGKYKVSFDVEVNKIHADSIGNEKQMALNDWIDVGVFGKTSKGKDTLIYLNKKLFKQHHQHIEAIVTQKPSKAAIDPLFKLIDRDTKDNVKEL